MPLPRVVSYVFIYCCESGTIKTDFLISIKTNTPSESGEISKKAKSSVYLKHVKACLMTWSLNPVCSSGVSKSVSRTLKRTNRFKIKTKAEKLKRLTGISFCAAYTIQEDPAPCSNSFPTCEKGRLGKRTLPQSPLIFSRSFARFLFRSCSTIWTPGTG